MHHHSGSVMAAWGVCAAVARLPAPLTLALALTLTSGPDGFAEATVPSVPPSVSSNAAALLPKIAAAAAPGVPATVSVAPGTYVFSNTSLVVIGARGLVIEAAGGPGTAVFVFYLGFGVVLNGCDNVTLRGVTFDSDPPNFAQGALTLGSPRASPTAWVADFDADFLAPDPRLPPFNAPGGLMGAKVRFWDPETRLPILVAGGFLQSSDALGGGRYRIHMDPPGIRNTTSVPDGALITVYPRRGVTFQSNNSSNVLVEDVTIHAGGNMGFHEQLGAGGNVYRRVAIIRKPSWRGLLALNADGFHSSDVGVGPTLEDSEISFTGDDFVNVHNRMLVVCEPAPGSGGSEGGGAVAVDALLVIDPSGGGLADLAAGDQITFYKLAAGAVHKPTPFLGSGTALSAATRVTDPAAVARCRNATEEMKAPPYNAQLVVSIASAPLFLVTFSAPLPPAVTATRFNLANFERRSGRGAVFRNNSFHDASGSGGRISAKVIGMQVINNVAERFGGMHVYEEPEWLEGDLGLRDVRVEGNLVVDPVNGLDHIDVWPGLFNVSCSNNTFVIDGVRTVRPAGC